MYQAQGQTIIPRKERHILSVSSTIQPMEYQAVQCTELYMYIRVRTHEQANTETIQCRCLLQVAMWELIMKWHILPLTALKSFIMYTHQVHRHI